MATTNVWNGNWFSNQKDVANAIQNLDSSGKETKTIICPAISGTTSASSTGWTNDGIAALPQSQTASGFFIPITGLKVGDVINSYTVHGQIDSAGNTATLDATLYRSVAVATGSTATNIGAITQVSVTADTLVASSKTLATAETVATNEAFYVYLAGTTAATTDIEVTSVEVSLN